MTVSAALWQPTNHSIAPTTYPTAPRSPGPTTQWFPTTPPHPRRFGPTMQRRRHRATAGYQAWPGPLPFAREPRARPLLGPRLTCPPVGFENCGQKLRWPIAPNRCHLQTNPSTSTAHDCHWLFPAAPRDAMAASRRDPRTESALA